MCVFSTKIQKKLCLVNKNLINAAVDDAELAINRLLQCAQLSDLGQAIIRYQNAIEYKQQQQ
jgi:hypothetical protein